MNKREKILAIGVVVVLGGWALMSWVIDPLIAAFDEVDAQTTEIEQALNQARALVDAEPTIRRQWLGYERAGLSRSLEQADAETGGALFDWAEDAGFGKVNLSDGKAKTDDEETFGELVYTLQTAGTLKQIYELLWLVRESPFPLRLDKCVIDLQRSESDPLQLSLTVSTLFDPQAVASRSDSDASAKPKRGAWQPPEEDRTAYRDIVDYNIFRSDRSRLAQQVERVRNPPPPRDPDPRDPDPEPVVVEKPPPNPDASWRLTGISHGEKGAVAFIEHTSTGELSHVNGPAEFSLGEIKTIGYDALLYLVDGEQRIIRIGETLVGTRVAPKGGTTSGTSAKGGSSKPGSLEDRLKALRERRAREQGTAPPQPAPAPESTDKPQAPEGNDDNPADPPAGPATTQGPASARDAGSNNS